VKFVDYLPFGYFITHGKHQYFDESNQQLYESSRFKRKLALYDKQYNEQRDDFSGKTDTFLNFDI